MSVTIRARMAMTGASETKSEMMVIAGTALRALSAANLLRYTIKDIRDLASGKGGLADIISLSTNSILLMYQLNMLLKANIALSGILKASLFAYSVPIALGATLLLGGAAIVNRQMQTDVMTGERNTRRDAARALGIQ